MFGPRRGPCKVVSGGVSGSRSRSHASDLVVDGRMKSAPARASGLGRGRGSTIVAMWSVSDVLEARRRLPFPDFAAKYNAPVLVCRARGDVGDASGTFETTAPGMILGARSEARLGHTSSLFVVRKRAGSAFPDRIGIGRAKGTDVCISLPEISKYHAYFVFDAEQGTWSVADAGSSNGTFVDGRPVEANNLVALRSGCVVRLGIYPFRFYDSLGLYRALGDLLFGGSSIRPAPIDDGGPHD